MPYIALFLKNKNLWALETPPQTPMFVTHIYCLWNRPRVTIANILSLILRRFFITQMCIFCLMGAYF